MKFGAIYSVPLLVTGLTAAGCTQKQIYQVSVENQRQECEKLTGSAYQECIETLSGPYEDYQRDRKELIKDTGTR